MGLKYTKRAMTSYEVHRFFHGLEISFFPDTFYSGQIIYFSLPVGKPNQLILPQLLQQLQ